jgi:hypothetical protein
MGGFFYISKLFKHTNMKKIILLLSVVFLTTTTLQAQDSKFYLGIGAGYATAGGDDAQDVKGGVNLRFLDMGYRFNESWGVTAGLVSSGHGSSEGIDATLGIASFAIGPMYSVPVGTVSWDIKPQFALSYVGKTRYANEIDIEIEDGDYKGSAFILGNSFIFGDGGRGFTWSIDVDYRMGTFKEFEYLNGETIDFDDDLKISNLSFGVGLRYNF